MLYYFFALLIPLNMIVLHFYDFSSRELVLYIFIQIIVLVFGRIDKD